MLRIKEILHEKGMMYKELADKIGISKSALSLSLNGNPTLDRLAEIAKALDVPISELFEQPEDGRIICPHCGKAIHLNPQIIPNN